MSTAANHHGAENVGVLPGLPGSDTSPGTGPAVRELFVGLLEDTGLSDTQDDPASAVEATSAAAGYGDLVGALVVPARRADRVAAGLDAHRAAGRADPRVLDLVLAADPSDADPLAAVSTAASALAGRDDIRLVAVWVGLSDSRDQADAAADLAGRLSRARLPGGVRVWVQVRAGRDRRGALEVLAGVGDGVGVSLTVAGQSDLAAPDDLAAALRACVDTEVPVRLDGGPARAVRGPDPATGVTGHGVLNAVGAMRAVLNGAEVPQVADVLASTDVAALASGIRRISEADAAVLRAFLVTCAVPDAAAPAGDLAALGLLPPW